MPIGRFTPEQWLHVLRWRWAVENQCHNTWDRLMREDKRPWIHHPQGMVVVHLLRAIAHSALAIFRSVTQRSEDRRRVPWKQLFQALYVALCRVTEATLASLRPRRPLLDTS